MDYKDMTRKGMVDKYIAINEWQNKRNEIMAKRSNELENAILKTAKYKKGDYLTNRKDVFILNRFSVSKYKKDIELEVVYLAIEDGCLSKTCMHGYKLENELTKIDIKKAVDILSN